MKMTETSKGKFRMAPRVLGTLGLALALMIMALPMGGSRAEASGLPAYYPQSFDGEGQIYEFRKGVVIIDDRLMRLAEGVRFYTRWSQSASQARFPKGTLVGYKKNQAGEITGIWLMPETDI
jgi:hypothetical protein